MLGCFSLLVLGIYSPYPPHGGACPGYFLQTEKTAILLECGSGVISKLSSPDGKLPDIDALLLSHLHGDHCSDFMVLRYCVDRAIALGQRKECLRVYAPDFPREVAALIPYKNSLRHVPFDSSTWRISSAVPQSTRIGDVEVSFAWTDHPIPTLAMRFEANGRILAYSADTEDCSAVRQIAGNADVFLCEATFVERDSQGPGTALSGHLSGRKAARIAYESNVKRLILTHLPPDGDAKRTLEEAKEVFPNAEIAEEGKSYEI